jgi:muramidase (phage lysozyme)
MADDKLKIVASVEDQFTGPLDKLKKGLKGVGDETAKHAAVWKKDWAEARGEIQKVQGALGGFTPILSAIGMGGFGAALSIGGFATALKGFSGQTRDLGLMARQIGLTTNELRTLSELGGKVGVSADTMKGAINQFATNMVDLRQRWGRAYGELKNMNLGKLAEDLVNAPNMEAAIERAMEGLKDVPDPQKRARVSMLLFGTPDVGIVASNLGEPIKQALRRLQGELGEIDKATEESAKKFEERLNRLNHLMEKGKLKVLGPALEGIVGIIDDAEKNGLSGNEREQEMRRQLSPFGGPAVSPRETLEGRRNQVQSQLDLLERGPRGADYQRKHDRMVEELKRVADELKRLRENGGGASITPSGYGGPASGSGGSLIQKAAWGGFGGSAGAGAAIPAYGSPAGGGGGASGSSDVPNAPAIGGGARGRSFGGEGALGEPRGALGAEVPIGDRGMLDLIARAEGTTRRGYNDSFAHQVGGDLMGKTLGEIQQIQRGMRGSSAIGRYQFMRGTLFGSGRKGDRGLMGELDLSPDDKFTPELQDRLANALIERRYKEAKRAQAKHGGDFMRHFRTALAREWASFPGDYGQRGRNGGMYPGQSASIGRDRLTEGAQRWLDEREGKVARSPSGASRRSEVLADPNDERRKPDDGGIKQLKPWTKVPAIPSPVTRVDMEDDGGMYGGTGALKGKDDFEAWLKRMHEEEAKNPISPEQLEQQRRGYDRDAFVDAMKERAGRGTKFGNAENEAVNDPDRTTADGLKRSLAYYGSKMRGWTGEVEDDDALRRSGLQGRSSDPAYRPNKDLSLDEIRKFRGPDRKVGDALMDRFYGKGAVGGGPAMQMPGGSGAGGKGSLHIKVDGPAGMQVKADMSDLFGDTTVSHGKSQMNL